MKCRTNFVSNSSSTSFVVDVQEYNSVIDLAKAMVVCREWGKDDIDLLKKLQRYQYNVQFDKEKCNVGVAFRSCNYDTYIQLIGGKYVVGTCNNHPWYERIAYSRNFPLELKYYAKREGYEDDLPFFVEMFASTIGVYWFPEFFDSPSDCMIDEVIYMKKLKLTRPLEYAKVQCDIKDEHEYCDVLISTDGRYFCRGCLYNHLA